MWVEEEVEVKDKAEAAAEAAVREKDRGVWVAEKPPDRAANASAPVAGTGCRTRLGSPAMSANVPAAARP